ncbi:hypothetical protein D5S17_15800 [Pseudonocardiaceae bacterium YIM PH 21723]|nr:hypothetical protein D5S17_15800 [Pseudonocardiaceae bacterium YIM PH 21723]
MSWTDAIPTAAACLAWLLLPGLAAAWALGLRGIAAVASAPAVSMIAIAGSATAYPLLGLRWGITGALVTSAVLVLVCLGIGWLLSRRGLIAPDTGRWRDLLALGAGLIIAAAIGTSIFQDAAGTPDRLIQAYDAIFHYNAVTAIVDSGNGSTLTLNKLVNPLAGAGFYPAGWHDLAALTKLTAGSGTALVCNAVALISAVLLFPLSSSLLVRQVAGRSAGLLLAVPVLSIAFVAFPWTMISYGTLWPNALALALVPVGLAALVSLCGMAREDAFDRPRAVLVLLAACGGCGLVHPNAFFSLLAIGVPIAAIGLLRWVLGQRREGRFGRALGIALVLCAAALGAAFVIDRMSIFHAVRGTIWPTFHTPLSALQAVLVNGTQEIPAPSVPMWALSVPMLLGLLIALLRRQWRWLVASYAVLTVLYVLASAVNNPLKTHISGYWYNNAPRLGAMLPLLAVPLIAITLVEVGGLLARLYGRPMDEASGAKRARVLTSLVAVAGAVAIVTLPGGLDRQQLTNQLAGYYTPPVPGLVVVDDQERKFFHQVAQRVPAEDVVAANPWTGSPMLWALEGRRVLWTALGTPDDKDTYYLAQHLDQATTDPKVCPLLDRFKVRYVLDDGDFYWPWDPNLRNYPGLVMIGKPGFQLVLDDGKHRLYEITACR